MSTSLLYHEHGLKSIQHLSTSFKHGNIFYKVQIKPNLIVCPLCRSQDIIKKGKITRQIRTPTSRINHSAFLVFDIPRVYCKHCDIIRQVKIPFADANKSYSKRFAQTIIEKRKHETIKSISKEMNVPWDLIKEIIKGYLEKKYIPPDIKNLKHLAVDEIAICKGHVYITLVMNLDTGNVIFVGDGKGADALEPFWVLLGKRRMNKIKAIAIDMGPSYISAIKLNLPNTKIVFDHFHVVKLMNDALDKIRRREYAKATDEEKKVFKTTKWILLKNAKNIDKEKNEHSRLEQLLAINKSLTKGYLLKEKLRQIWSQDNKEIAMDTLLILVDSCKTSDVKELVTLGETLYKHCNDILNWYDFKITSGKMEGLNNKIKTLKRMAYGYTDMDFFKLRILDIHNSEIIITG
jgi:transposase